MNEDRPLSFSGFCCETCDGNDVGAAPAESVEQLKATLQALQSELIACQRLALLGSLAAMAAHEFNNLMTPIVARTEAALHGGDVAFMRKTLDRTLTQSQRAIAVSRHLLDLAHCETELGEKCAVAEAVQEAVETATRPFEKDGIHLRVTVPEELEVRARSDLFCQVLLNLLLNARTAMKNREGVLAITAEADDVCVRIDVRDSGKGISPEQIENVFNPFLAADPRARPNDWQEVGLGLSVCRLIAHHHGASLRVLANDGPGCTFRLCWPRH